MRVCILTSSFPRFRGDLSGSFVYLLAKHLVKDGMDVIVLAPHENRLAHKETLSGIKVIRFPYFYPKKLQQLSYGSGITTNIKKNRLALLQIPFFSIAQIIFLVWVVIKYRINVINSHWMIPQGFNSAILNHFFGFGNI